MIPAAAANPAQHFYGLLQKAGAFIFDLDGTLYDPRSFARRLLFCRLPKALFPETASAPPARWSLEDIRLSGCERHVRKAFSGADYGNAEAYYEKFFAALENKSGKSAEVLRRWYFKRCMPRMTGVLKAHYAFRPGTAELFAALQKAGLPCAIYSDYPLVRERLEALGLEGRNLCGMLLGPEDFGAQKPAARPFLEIARRFRRDPAETLVVGDRDDTDGAGAAAAGMAFVKIAAGKNRGGLDWKDFCDLVTANTIGIVEE